eukprot:365052-Chlamydomonas_euryale.AAC.1
MPVLSAARQRGSNSGLCAVTNSAGTRSSKQINLPLHKRGQLNCLKQQHETHNPTDNVHLIDAQNS